MSTGWLNYHHLLYFWTVAREGGLTPAAAKLRLAHPTISAQIHTLEDTLGEKLFRKEGRRLVLTEMGRIVYRYADEIFALGGELMEVVQGRPTGRPLRLTVGVADVVPKLIASRLLLPAQRLPDPVRIVCREDTHEHLLADLALHSLDVVISDAPVGNGTSVKAFNHLLGECSVTFYAMPELARRYRSGFPRSLHGAPLLMPLETTALRGALDQWFASVDVRPEIVAEFEDSALLMAFGQDGMGIFPGSTVISKQIEHQYSVVPIGSAAAVKERFYAITVERKIRHPAVVAISQAARTDLFG
jgi:LysR family transcriptional activator of nhaA